VLCGVVTTVVGLGVVVTVVVGTARNKQKTNKD